MEATTKSNATTFAIYAEEPPPTNPRGGQPKWAKRIEELRKLPHGHWYVIARWDNRTSASCVKSLLSRRHPEIEFKYHSDRAANNSKLYARVKEAK